MNRRGMRNADKQPLPEQIGSVPLRQVATRRTNHVLRSSARQPMARFFGPLSLNGAAKSTVSTRTRIDDLDMRVILTTPSARSIVFFDFIAAVANPRELALAEILGCGSRDRIRTCDPLINSQLLYR